MAVQVFKKNTLNSYKMSARPSMGLLQPMDKIQNNCVSIKGHNPLSGQFKVASSRPDQNIKKYVSFPQPDMCTKSKSP